MRRSNSTRSVRSQASTGYNMPAYTDNAARNRAASAAAAAAAALQRSDSRRGISSDDKATTATQQQPGLVRRDSLNSVRSAATNISSRPGQYSAVRATGGKRLLAAQAARQSAVQSGNLPPPQLTSHNLHATLRSGGGAAQSSGAPRVRQVMPSNASIRSFQSDLERINEDYNKTYAYNGQTSASAMRSAASRPRRPESVISSAASDTSEVIDANGRRRAGSRVSFSDIDENEVREPQGLNVSPNPNKPKRSALKHSPAQPSLAGGKPTDRQANQAAPPRLGIATVPNLTRRGSNASIGSASGAVAPPLAKESNTPALEDDQGSLSTIQSRGSVYSDADEDFRQSPQKRSPKKSRTGAAAVDSAAAAAPLALTQQNLAAMDTTPANSPLKSAMRKTPSQQGSVRFSRAEVASNLDADDESDDSFTRRRKASRNGGTPRSFRSSMRNGGETNGRASSKVSSTPAPAAPVLQRSNSQMSNMSRMSQDPVRMRSLRKDPSTTNMATRAAAPGPQQSGATIGRRMSLTSLRGEIAKPAGGRRTSIAGSVAGSVHEDAVDQHLAALAIAQRNVQKMLHPETEDAKSSDPVHNEANAILARAEQQQLQRRSSFERKRQGLSRRDSTMSVNSMADRTFRTTLRQEPASTKKQSRRSSSQAPSVAAAGHRRSESLEDQRYARPKGAGRSISAIFGRSAHTHADLSALAASTPGTSTPPVVPVATSVPDQSSVYETPKKMSKLRRVSLSLVGKSPGGKPTNHQNSDLPTSTAKDASAIPPMPTMTLPMRRLSVDSDVHPDLAESSRRQVPAIGENRVGAALTRGTLRNRDSSMTVATLARVGGSSPTQRQSDPNAPELPAKSTRRQSLSVPAARPSLPDRTQSQISVSKRTGKPKKFQKLRKLLGIRD
ncbi:hypothetical protein PYCC9005_001836 [Savitreella phatthalungensis]